MGVDTKIYLPGNVRHRDVADVMGIIMGLPKEIYHFGKGDSWSYKVPGVKIENSSVIGLAEFHFEGDLIDGKTYHYCSYHFEYEKGRLLMPPSTNFWVAVGIKLVDFFGGEIDFNDCDSIDCDYSKPPRPDWENDPGFNLNVDGKFQEIGWGNVRKRKGEIVPLTVEDLENAYQSAYWGVKS